MSDATKRLKVSREGVVLIKSFEGFRPRAARDEDGRWVIGYGHTASAREGLTISEQDAELLLQYDLLPVVKALNEQVSGPLNQHQFDALASFAISVGVDRFLASDVRQRLNDGQSGEAADALIGWPEATPPDARLRRRAAERALFVADPATPMLLADLLSAPLPPPPVRTPDFSAARPEARAAAVASLLGEPPPAAPEPVETPPTFTPGTFPSATPVTMIHLQRYSPYSAAIIGPLPGFPATAAPPAAAPDPVADAMVESAPPPEPDPEPTHEPQAEPGTIPVAEAEPSTPVVPLVPPAPGVSPFPPLEETLVLTPATEADFAEAPRPTWESEQREESAADDEAVLFGDEPMPPVMRREVEPASPRRFDWGETGAFLVMGGVGLAACAAAAAAFRKAMTDGGSLGDYTLIGWILALIGVICVGLSSWNLYTRWGRRD